MVSSPPVPAGTIRRLAVLDRGEAALRILAAADILGREGGRRTVGTVVAYVGGSAPWHARDADEALRLPQGAGARGTTDPEPAAEALAAAGVDLVWPSADLCPDLPGLQTALADRGIRMVGPDAQALRRLTDPQALAELAADCGLDVETALVPGDEGAAAGRRTFVVFVVRDAAGHAWVFGPAETTVRRGATAVLAELPAAGLEQAAAERMRGAARNLLERADLRGAGTVRFALDGPGAVALTGVDPVGRPDHSLWGVATGADLVALVLAIAAGAELPTGTPAVDGHTLEARIVAQDPEAGFRPSGGRIALLTPPTGVGVHADLGLREGDVVDAHADPLIVTLTAWGHDRAQAFDRARAALDRVQVVIPGGATNRTALLALLGRDELSAGPVDASWYDALIAAGDAEPTPDPAALVIGAVEVYEADLAEVRRSFRASAARGRPQHPERVGQTINLAYRGVAHRLRVDRVSAQTYQVRTRSGQIQATVDRVGDFTRRVTINGRKYRVTAVTADDRIRLEIDGVAHTVERQDGVVVRTQAPALVSAVLVETGQQVVRGQAVAALESMKMTTTVVADVDGRVTSVAVLPNEQVGAGVPLVRIRPAKGALAPSRSADAGDSLGKSGSSAEITTALDGLAGGVTRDIFERLQDYLLGYDLEAANIGVLQADYRSHASSLNSADPALLAAEDAFLDLFADIGSLYRPRTEAESGDRAAAAELAGRTNTQEYFLAFLTWLDADRAGLPLRYRARLERALSRYGVTSLTERAALEDATLWMFRSFSRVPTVAPLVVEMLGRRLGVGRAYPDTVTQATKGRLERLVRASEGRHPQVTDLARDVLFHLFDEPVLSTAEHEAYADAKDRLQALGQARGAERESHIAALVANAYPQRPVLLEAWLGQLEGRGEEADSRRDGVLETYLRRFYRMREMKSLGVDVINGIRLGHGTYALDLSEVHVVVAYAPLSDLGDVAQAVSAHLAVHAFQQDAVVDLVTWQDESAPDIEASITEIQDLLADCDFGRSLRRLDVTLTYLQGEEKQFDRTHHVTFRSGDDGNLVEDRVYRSMHPMLAKRLELWRLSNFELTRLPAPEDLYVFDGVARENPKDRRIFALGEVRDLGPIVDEHTGVTSYPRLGRIGLEALAAMRAALAQYPARQRPTANRLVLVVRPVWNVPPENWHALAATYEDLARGAGLEKVVLHVRLPQKHADGTVAIVARVLTLEGLGGGSLSVRVSEVGPNPVRPLTAYAQKVLTAARFGSPYPYEIVRMLTPAPGDTSDFPTGSFQEMDLGPDDELVPVDREPGRNQAHLVVGTITNVTGVHPDGMTRVAILSDPTQGLGNLAEPECRRINAVLAYALEHRLPVEWYAVSSGALIAMDSGTENMDWISLTLRRIIEFTQAGGEINIIVTGINVGGQPYWNAEATMLLHTRGILIMTPASAMVLTGKQALDFSGAVSADDNDGIGGYDRIMGPNGQAQYWAPSFPEACSVLLRHYDFTYVVPGELYPRRRPTADPATRDVRPAPHALTPGSTFTTVGDIFDHTKNAERKSPFDMRSVMRAVADSDCAPLERWRDWVDADTVISWDATIGGIPVCLLGMESHRVTRRGFVPSYGPPAWTSGTLFPQSSRKCARTVNAASGNRPLVVLGNLSGFDGSPESMRNWQLEYGAEIGRAITNFRGPIVFVVVSRYHGGAFVVFSKQLNASMEIAAVEGSYASVIGGAPAAATVFAREVKSRTEKDSRVIAAREAAAAATGEEAGRLRVTAARTTEIVRSERLREVADEFDGIHTIERAQRVGSVDRIIPGEQLRPYVIDALERGMAVYAARIGVRE